MGLINLRNALMAGKRLPYDAEVEYLESTGTQYINLGKLAFAEFRVSLAPVGLATPHYTYAYLGWNNDGSRTTGIYSDAVGTLNIRNNANASIGATVSDWTSFHDISYNGGVATVDGTDYNIKLSNSPTYDFCLFGLKKSETNIGLTKCRIAAFSAKNQDGDFIVDFIPVRVGTVGYLYDRVSGKLFGNAGTGDFVLGPDVVPVEWLEGGQLDSGIAFINTGYTPNSSTKIESTATVLSASGYSGRFGSRSRLTFGWFTNGNLYLAQGDHYYLGGWTAGTFYSFVNDIPNRTVSVEGVGSTSTAAVSDWYPQLYPVYLFASNVDPITGTNVNGKELDFNSLGRIRMKSCNILENDITVRKFRPVRVGTDATSWEGAMIDTLTRRIYRNAGTGAFSYGNDLKYPIPA